MLICMQPKATSHLRRSAWIYHMMKSLTHAYSATFRNTTQLTESFDLIATQTLPLFRSIPHEALIKYLALITWSIAFAFRFNERAISMWMNDCQKKNRSKQRHFDSADVSIMKKLISHDLEVQFAPYGEVVGVQKPTIKSETTHFAFVQFTTSAAAEKPWVSICLVTQKFKC